jgi:RNA polymerase sigma factor (sigma-70 family)
VPWYRGARRFRQAARDKRSEEKRELMGAHVLDLRLGSRQWLSPTDSSEGLDAEPSISNPDDEADGASRAAAEQAERLICCLPMLRTYVRRLVGDRERASDVLQNVSVTILTTSGSPTELVDFAAWCRGVARNVAAYELRSRRRLQHILSVGDDLEDAADPIADPEDNASSRTELARLTGQLDHGAFELLYRRYVLGESAKDLAIELAQSPAALRMRLMRLRSQLRAGDRTPQ